MRQLFIYPLLLLASGLYGAGVRLRLWLYRRRLLTTRRLPLKVISIGNLAAGGSGKTPHTALLADFLQKKGIKTAVLSRGYRGTKMRQGAIISDGISISGTLEEGGEEPYWLAQRLPDIPVVVGKDRFRSGMVCFQKWQTEWVVLDDGFQYLSLKREIDILLIAGHRPFNSGRLLPLGFLWEPIKEMRRADLVLITHAERLDFSQQEEVVKKIHSWIPSTPVFFSQHKPTVLWTYPDRGGVPFSDIAGKQVVGFCGLADPESLAFSLKQIGADMVKLVEFPDHHFYREKDKRSLETLSRSLKIKLLVTTEKDALKLGKWETADLHILVLGIEAEVLDRDFWELLEQNMKQEARGARYEA